MWADFTPRAMTREQLAARIASLKWTSWKPIGIVLHNTAAPTLAQWAESGPKHDARIANLQQFYEGKGWHGGPHWFVSREYINEFNNPLRRGTHSPSFNATHFGIEMVGDYNGEPFGSGDGAKVRDNAVFLMATLCKRFGWDIGKVLKFHKEDPKTNHDCPGHLVVKADIIARVRTEMMKDGSVSSVVSKPAGRQTGILATEFGGEGDAQSSAYGGQIDPEQYQGSLPARVPENRRNVRVFYGSKSLVIKVNDVGPWNRRDAYWDEGTRPLAEAQFKEFTTAQNGKVATNAAGIDLTPAVFDELGIKGKRGTRSAKVDWEFTSALPKQIMAQLPPIPDVEPPPEQEVAEANASGGGFWGLLGKIGAFFGGGGAALLYDWRVVAIILFAVAVLIALFVDREHIKRLVNQSIEKMLRGR